jgi:hypothetical protein
MKQDKNWATVSVSYKQLELYKLIEQVILKQTEDQYPVAALWEQLTNVVNAKQTNLTNNEWYDWFNTKVEVAKSVGVNFDFKKIWEYYAQEVHKAASTKLQPDEQEAVRVSARERFPSYALIKMSNSKYDKIKDDLSDDYTKGNDNYPQTRSQTLMLMDHYSKTPTAITTSEVTLFAQSGKNKKKGNKDEEKKSNANKDPKDFDKVYWKDKKCYKCSKNGHPATACTAKVVASDDDKKSTKSSKSSKSASFAAIQKSMKSMGKAVTQLSESAGFDDKQFDEQLHAQLGTVGANMPGVKSEYSFAAKKALLLMYHLLLDNQSLVHIMCDPAFVENIWRASQEMVLKSNGGKLLVNEVAYFEGFEKETWFSRSKMTNILSFLLVKSEFKITYDGEDFIIHQAAKGYLDMVFKPHKNGLHVDDPDNPRGLASYLFMETGDSNMALFTKRQIHGANLACNLQASLAFPSNQDMKWAIQSNLIKDCPVTIKDMGMAIKVWGPSIAMLKGKPVRTTPTPVR